MSFKDYLFWFILGLIAVFYLAIGNKMHEERYKIFTNDLNATTNAKQIPSYSLSPK